MKLYKIEPINKWDDPYDKQHAVITAAKSSRTARKIASEHAGDEGKNVWLDSSKTSCKEIGTTKKELFKNPCLVLRDYIGG